LAALYRKQILTALQDVENALIAVKELGRQLKLQGAAVVAARRAFEASDMRLQEGTIDIITLSTTQKQLFDSQEQEAVIRLNYFQAATSLYQALGGGYDAGPDAFAPRPAPETDPLTPVVDAVQSLGGG